MGMYFWYSLFYLANICSWGPLNRSALPSWNDDRLSHMTFWMWHKLALEIKLPLWGLFSCASAITMRWLPPCKGPPLLPGDKCYWTHSMELRIAAWHKAPYWKPAYVSWLQLSMRTIIIQRCWVLECLLCMIMVALAADVSHCTALFSSHWLFSLFLMLYILLLCFVYYLFSLLECKVHKVIFACLIWFSIPNTWKSAWFVGHAW